MKLKKIFNRKITMTRLQHSSLIIITLLATSFGIKIWPRFRADALSFPWQGYVLLIAIFSVGLFWKRKR
jgi:hypothetical protein